MLLWELLATDWGMVLMLPFPALVWWLVWIIFLKDPNGWTESPGGEDSANPAHWHCRVSNPVPTDLQFCHPIHLVTRLCNL